MKVKLLLLVVSLMLSACTVGRYYLAGSQETIVFVHGAHLTARSWYGVENIFSDKGYQTISVNLPGRELTDNPKEVTLDKSSQYLCEEIASIKTPLVIVAHSQGGALVNHALSLCAHRPIKSIVYIAAVAPLNGSQPFSLLSQQDEENYFTGVAYDKKSGWLLISDFDKFFTTFSHFNTKKIKRAVKTQVVAEPAVIADGVVSYKVEDYSKIKKFYIQTRFDKIISLASQKRIVNTIDVDWVVTLDSGHIPMVTMPVELAVAIDQFLQ